MFRVFREECERNEHFASTCNIDINQIFLVGKSELEAARQLWVFLRNLERKNFIHVQRHVHLFNKSVKDMEKKILQT